jgi:hypothetical protein
MRLRGIHYDIGTATLEGASTRETLTPDVMAREIAEIAGDLHANAIRITGGDIARIAAAGRLAAERGLDAWMSPMYPNADMATTLARIEEAADEAERLRKTGAGSVLVVGCELSAFMAGILPGDNQAQRLELLSDVNRLMEAVAASGVDPQARFAEFLADAVRSVRGRFGGQVTYASGGWEEVDWSLFDIVGVDAYRDAANRAGYVDQLRSYARFGKPVVITEFGCATYRGAADAGGLGWTAVERSSRPRRLRSGIVRDEAAQASDLAETLRLIEQAGAGGCFVYTYVAPSYPASDEPEMDLDTASYALVRSWPNGRTSHKAAFDAVAAEYTRAG